MAEKTYSKVIVGLSLVLLLVFIATATIGSNSIIRSKLSEAKSTPSPSIEATTDPTSTPEPVEATSSTEISDPDVFFDEYDWSTPRRVTNSRNYMILVSDTEAGSVNEPFYLSGRLFNLDLTDVPEEEQIGIINRLSGYYGNDLKTAGWKETVTTEGNQKLTASASEDAKYNKQGVLGYLGGRVREIVTEASTSGDIKEFRVFVSDVYEVEKVVGGFE